jgi:hypothetical protein
MKRLYVPPFKNARLSIIWAAIAALQPEEALELALVLHEMLGRGSFPSTREKGRRAEAIACLRQAAEELRHSPSVREYENLREKRRDLELVASGSVRTRLGAGWNDCLKMAQLQIVPDGDLPVQRRARFTDDEILDALRACHEAIGNVPTVYTYKAWAGRPEVIDSPAVRPRTEGPIIKAFGSFGAALRAAGIVGQAVRRGNRLDPVEWSYVDEELLGALKLIHERLGFSPTVAEYTNERRKWLAEQLEAGNSPQPLPGAGTIMRRFSTWSQAFAAADLPDRRARTRRSGPKSPRFSNEDILETLRSAYAEVGEPFTIDAYTRWRTQRLLSDPNTAIPSVDTVVSRFRNWQVAIDRALTEADDDEGAAGVAVAV